MQTLHHSNLPLSPSPAHRCALLAFPVLLWLIATFFYFGEIGLWNDDWFYIQRTPETGVIRALTLDRPIHFWRPLYRVIVPAFATLLSKHIWLLHLLSALAHAITTWLFYVLLMRLRMRPLAAAIGALIFLVFPWDTEVVFWCCNLPTSLSATLTLWALCIAAKARIRPFRIVFPAFILTFAACCLNEQPALIAFALPFVALAAQRSELGADTPTPRRIVLLFLAPLAAIASYTLLARWIVGPMDIGAGHGLLPPTRWPATIAEFFHWLGTTVGSAHWLTHAWRHGAAAARDHPLRAAVLGLALPISAGFWIASINHARDANNSPDHAPRTMLWLGASGVVITLAPLGPIIVFAYWFNPRVLYPSALGLGFLFALAFSFLSGRAGERDGSRVGFKVGMGVLALILSAAALAMVGVQHAYRERDRLDRSVLGALRELIPNPAPGSVFVPVCIDTPDWLPHSRAFEGQFCSNFNSWWSAEPALRVAYGRGDVYCGYCTWGSIAWVHPGPLTVGVINLGRTPWSSVIPFSIDSHNTLHLITAISYTTRAGESRTIEVSQTKGLATSGRIPPYTWTFSAPTLGHGSRTYPVTPMPTEGASPPNVPLGVSLRDVGPEDLSTLFAFQNEPESCAMAMVKPRSETAFLAVWEKIFRDRAEGLSGAIGKAILAGDGMGGSTLCGSIGCFALGGQSAVGYGLGRAHWGKGIASRAVTLLLTEHPIRPLHARAAASNGASIRVLLKNGFAVTGRQFSPETDRYLACEEVLFELA